MMNIEKIIIANNGMEIRITEMNNRQVVRDGIYRMTECVNLIDNDYTIDYKTIAGLLCMTEEEFKRNYKLGRTESEREDRVCGADWILTYAEFTKKDEFEILLDAIQNGDIKIADDEPEDYEDYEEYEKYENNNVEVDDMKIYNNGPTLENCIKTDSGYYENYVIDDLFADGGIYYDCVIGTGDNTGGTFNHCEFVELIASGGVYSYCYVGSGGRLVGGTYNDCEICNVTYDSDKCIFNDCKLVNCTDIKPKEEKPVMVPHNNMVIAKIQEQMVKALEECDFETYDKLEERLNRLNK